MESFVVRVYRCDTARRSVEGLVLNPVSGMERHFHSLEDLWEIMQFQSDAESGLSDLVTSAEST
jgi:hypothetical protein